MNSNDFKFKIDKKLTKELFLREWTQIMFQ